MVIIHTIQTWGMQANCSGLLNYCFFIFIFKKGEGREGQIVTLLAGKNLVFVCHSNISFTTKMNS